MHRANKRDNFLSCFIFSLIDALRSLEQQNSSTQRISELSNKSESSRKMYDHSEPKRCIEWWQSSIRNLRKEKPVFSISLNPFLLRTGGLNLKLYGNTLFSLHQWLKYRWLRYFAMRVLMLTSFRTFVTTFWPYLSRNELKFVTISQPGI